MSNETILMAILTHPYHAMLMGVVLFHAVRSVFSARRWEAPAKHQRGRTRGFDEAA